MSIPRISSRAVVIRDNKLLAIYRFKGGKEYYVFPGGGIEEGETPEQAVIRELKEETSLEVEIIRQFELQRPEHEEYYFICEYISGIPKLSPESVEAMRQSKDNIYRLTWLDLRGLKDVLLYPIEVRDKVITEFLEK